MQDSTFFFNLIVPTNNSESAPQDAFHFWEQFTSNDEPILDAKAMEDALDPWFHWKIYCLPLIPKLFYDEYRTLADYAEIAQTQNYTRYRWHFSAHAQSDFLYVPTQYGRILRPIAEVLSKHKIFHECGVPAMVFWATMEYYKSNMFDLKTPPLNTQALNLSDHGVPQELFSMQLELPRYWTRAQTDESFPILERFRLCTSFDGDREALDYEIQLVQHCMQEAPNHGEEEYGVFHPIKLGVAGPSTVERLLLELNRD